MNYRLKDIRSLQLGLVRLGYNPGPFDGLWGPKTLAKVKIFQHDHGLKIDGVPGPRTRNALAWALRDMRLPVDTEDETEYSPAAEKQDTGDSYQSVTSDSLRRAVLDDGYIWETDPGWINLAGVRGFLDGRKVENRFDEYNDTIYLVSKRQTSAAVDMNDSDLVEMTAFRATVDPGRLREPNPRGVAHIVPGQYRYRIGLHRGRRPALVQADRITVSRYFDPGQLLDNPENNQVEQIRETGWFGINIHRGGIGERVGGWSAGCQVIIGDRWSDFMEKVQRAANLGQEEFRYTLFEGTRFTEVLSSTGE